MRSASAVSLEYRVQPDLPAQPPKVSRATAVTGIHQLNIPLPELLWLEYQRAAVAGGHRSVTAWARYTLHLAAGLITEDPAPKPSKSAKTRKTPPGQT